ncbi:hypothetical protein ACFXA3_16900 [Streptomyces sp. NPDC059456]|uniref:hypothetical protein n=1 Tax=Streptomyces sp. NPDC059456 TaxID=3346838 RepID=UPI0036AA06CC
MNTLKGFGACVVLAAIAYAVTLVTNTDQLMLGATAVIVLLSLIGYAASVRRKRRDYRVAGD